MDTRQINPEQLAIMGLKAVAPDIDPNCIDGIRFIQFMSDWEAARAEYEQHSDSKAVRKERDLRQRLFPEKFKAATGVHPTRGQIAEYEADVEHELDATANDSARTFWTLTIAKDREAEKVISEYAALAPEPDPSQRAAWNMELAAARDRARGLTYQRAADAILKADDVQDRALLFVFQQAVQDDTLDSLGLSGDPSTRTAIRKALETRADARLPKWVRAARERRRGWFSPVQSTKLQMLVNGQRIAKRSPTTRSFRI